MMMPAVPIGASGSGFAAAKISELESQLEVLRLQYTDKHPRIGQILDTIELLKQQQEQERLIEAPVDAGGASMPMQTNPLDLNPVYQNMRIQLTNTEVEIASLRAELAQQQNGVAELQRLVDTVPRVEAELKRLNRDYNVVKARYEQLLQRLETANIGGDAEQSMNEVQFRIIDPPFSGSQPAGPQRQIFLSMVFVAALGVAGGLTFLFNQLHPVFFSGRAVTAATGIPILGTVSLLVSPVENRVKLAGKLSLAVAFTALVVTFALVWQFAEQWSPALRGLKGMMS